MASTLRIRLLAFAAAVSVAGTARADKQKAREHYKQGDTLYTLGKFDEAIGEFEKGFEEEPDPVFLFNLGQCHRQLGHVDRALFYYKRYLGKKENPPNREQVERFIADLEEQQKRVAEPVPSPSPSPSPSPGVGAGTESGPGTGTQTGTGTPASTTTTTTSTFTSTRPEAATEIEPTRSDRRKIVAWSVAGAGVAMTAVGVVFGLQARSDSNTVDDCKTHGWSAACDDAQASGPTKSTIGVALMVTGGAVAAAGAAALYYVYTHDHEPHAALAPSVVPGGGAVVYAGSF